MIISLTEPVAPKFIHLSPRNKVHLIVPIIGGQEISTDNTCKVGLSLANFFADRKGALSELEAYKGALELDIQLLKADNPQRKLKEERLLQIDIYIDAVKEMKKASKYMLAVDAAQQRTSNLYSFQLKPRVQDYESRVTNPAFSVNRHSSALYNAMHAAYPSVQIGISDPKMDLKTAVLHALPDAPTFEVIQSLLHDKCRELFGMDVDFTTLADGNPATKAVMDAYLGADEDSPATPTEYMDILLSGCAKNAFDSLSTQEKSLFYTVNPDKGASHERVEQLSILTQFFLANANIYCKSQGLSTQNFGVILDAAPHLCMQLASIVSSNLSTGGDVEGALIDFLNNNRAEFQLNHPITAEAALAIKQRFARTYKTVSGSDHMDDFMILDMGATGPTSLFVTHQGAIGIDFAEIIDRDNSALNQAYFAGVRHDFVNHPVEIPHRNDGIAGETNIEVMDLLQGLSPEQFAKLPESVKQVCKTDAGFQKFMGAWKEIKPVKAQVSDVGTSFFALHGKESVMAKATKTMPDAKVLQFLQDAARGKQNEAEASLSASMDKQQLLLSTEIFTDHAGRSFNCSAYEYAYWAKDTHMCHMLAGHMDEATKAQLMGRIDNIDNKGLTYSQHGLQHRSKHYDLAPLKVALEQYIMGFPRWEEQANTKAILSAWIEIGTAQRDLPAHVVQELCNSDPAFAKMPVSSTKKLPRSMAFDNLKSGNKDQWFSKHLDSEPNFALIHGRDDVMGCEWRSWINEEIMAVDLAVINDLDAVRTSELLQLRAELATSSPISSLGG